MRLEKLSPDAPTITASKSAAAPTTPSTTPGPAITRVPTDASSGNSARSSASRSSSAPRLPAGAPAGTTDASVSLPPSASVIPSA